MLHTHAGQSTNQSKCDVNVKSQNAPEVQMGYRKQPFPASLLYKPINHADYYPKAGGDLWSSVANAVCYGG